jgi:hypothetical protein
VADLRSDLRQFFADWNALLPSLEVFLRAKAVISTLSQPNGLSHRGEMGSLEVELADLLADHLMLGEKLIDVAFVANEVLSEAAQPESPTAKTEPAPEAPESPEEPPQGPEGPNQDLPSRRIA